MMLFVSLALFAVLLVNGYVMSAYLVELLVLWALVRE